MAIDWEAIEKAGGIGKGMHHADARRDRKLTKQQLLDEAYERVDALDKGVCWVTGRVTVKGAADPKLRRERHHVKGRRVMPEWRHDENRIITVCAEAHDLLTRDKLVMEGVDRRQPVFFHWNCAPKYRPFEILPARLRKKAS